MRDVILICEDLFGLELLHLIREADRVLEKRGGETEGRCRVIGYVSDKTDPFDGIPCDIPRLGSLSAHENPGSARYVLGLLDPAAKRRAVEVVNARGGAFQTLISPLMYGAVAECGCGSVVFAYSAKKELSIGAYVTVVDAMLSCKEIGAFSTVLRFANLAGDGIGKDCLVGDHAFLAVGKSIGDGCTVQAGSLVIRDLRPGSRVYGAPARRMKG